MYHPNYLLVTFAFLTLTFPTVAQKATVVEELIEIPTYPFSDPNPIPILTSNPGIYPYHRFEGYSHEAKPVNWKVITLENDYLKVTILPEVGGKVWGAIEKSTGKDFIYQNKVMKFRNIAMRGPWTSGGIEFNFGIIGHTPATATPVDYEMSTHADGSVSCTVGMIDLPSRTQWRVRITLPADKAYFTTNATWYNPTPLSHPYYNWMTGAAKTTDDLAFYFPGNISLQHSGETTEWPINKNGKEIWQYKENNFGPSKSYHVSGKYHNFFGGYWHNEDIGFVHAGRHETMPGQKLWLWSLARNGGIWEDLLTDDNGQYMEFQAGRLLNQYFNDAYNNPITEMAFAPHLTDQWEERWFPAKQTNGITAITENVVFNIIEGKNQTEIKINALGPIDDNLQISVDGELIKETQISLRPMETYSAEFKKKGALKIKIGNETIFDSEEEKEKVLKRPYANNTNIDLRPAQKQYLMGSELVKRRKYSQAKSYLNNCLALEPDHLAAHNLIAEIHFKNGLYDSALLSSNFTLQIDTYDPDANYIAGLSYKALGDKYNALDALGIASRSMKYRSAAYTEIAQLELADRQIDLAIKDAKYALDFNSKNVSALQTLMIAQRIKGENSDAAQTNQALLDIDPLNHFARFETYLLKKEPSDLAIFKEKIFNEFPYQTYLEIASIYINANRFADASDVLSEAPVHPLTDLWLTFCKSNSNEPFETYLQRGLSTSVEFVFPYRQESVRILEWARSQATSWKLDYYLGLNYWSKDRYKEAAQLFTAAGERPDVASFYVSRSVLLSQANKTDRLSDLERALEIGVNDWRYHHEIIKYYEAKSLFTEQLKQSQIAAGKFPENYVIGLDLAQALVNNKEYDTSLEILSKINVLPSEGSFSGRQIYGKASLLRAIELFKKGEYKGAKAKLSLSYLYPENMGSGKPFDPDERHIDLFMAEIENKLGGDTEDLYNKIVNYSEEVGNIKFSIFTLMALERLGEKEQVNSLVSKLESNEHADSKWVIRHWENKTTPIEILTEISY